MDLTGRTAVGVSVAVAGGVALAVQGRVNGQLGGLLHSGVRAALVSFGVGLVILVAVVAATPRARAGLRRLRGSGLRWWQYAGGASGAFLVSGQGFTIPVIGVSVFTVAVVAGQVGSSLLVDRAGIGPGGPVSVTPWRAAGAVIAIAAVLLAVSDELSTPDRLWPAVLPLVAGAALAWQLAVNGRVREAADDVLVPTLINFGVGAAVLVLASTVDVILRGVPAPPPAQPWLYVGGILGIGAVVSMVAAVRLVSVLVVGLASVAGQLTGALLLDAVAPAPGEGLSAHTVAGAALTLVAVVVASAPVRGRLRG